jgi:hypothetical protein
MATGSQASRRRRAGLPSVTATAGSFHIGHPDPPSLAPLLTALGPAGRIRQNTSSQH